MDLFLFLEDLLRRMLMLNLNALHNIVVNVGLIFRVLLHFLVRAFRLIRLLSSLAIFGCTVLELVIALGFKRLC